MNTNSVKYLGSHEGMWLNIFLVIVNRITYLICWQPENKEFGYMCPCCMWNENHRAIDEAISTGVANGDFELPVRWCSHLKDEEANSQMSVRDDRFILGDAKAELAEMRDAIHAEAERQIVAGNIRLQADRTSQF